MKRFSLFLAVTALGVVPATIHASTLLSENFNELTTNLEVTSAGAFSAIDGTNVDIVNGGLCPAPESGNCIDLDGSNGISQGVLQSNSSFTLSPGTDYYLSFDLIGSQRGPTASVTVNFGPYDQIFDLTSSDDTDGIVADQLVTVTSTEVTNLTFTSNTPGDVGLLLDNVLITSGPAGTSAVPEPSSLIPLVSSLLLGSVVLARRRRRTCGA